MNRIDEEKVAIGTLQISSKSLARNLNHCEKAVLFGATLGTAEDRLIARTSLTQMAKRRCSFRHVQRQCWKNFVMRNNLKSARNLKGRSFFLSAPEVQSGIRRF